MSRSSSVDLTILYRPVSSTGPIFSVSLPPVFHADTGRVHRNEHGARGISTDGTATRVPVARVNDRMGMTEAVEIANGKYSYFGSNRRDEARGGRGAAAMMGRDKNIGPQIFRGRQQQGLGVFLYVTG